MSRSPIKGLARASRNAFVVKREIEYLSRGAEEAIFQLAEVLSEGSERASAPGGRSYFGSTMISVDLDRLGRQWRGALDEPARERLLELVRRSVRVRVRASRIACAEVARRVTERPLGAACTDTTFRIAGGFLQMDVDVEVPVGVSSQARRAH